MSTRQWWSSRRSQQLVSLLVAGLLFLTPSNLFLKWPEHTGYVNGLLVDYLLPKFFLSDILVLIIILLAVISPATKLVRPKKWLIIFGSLALVLGFRQCFSPYPIASLWYFAKLLEMVGLSLALMQLKPWLKHEVLAWGSIATVIFQLVVSLGQFWRQDSLLGYWFLGEGKLGAISGIVHTSLNGVDTIAPYGTTAHPNVLAGSLVFFWWLGHLLARSETQKRILWSVTLPLALVLFLTQSASAWLMAAIAVALVTLQPRISLQRWAVWQIWVILSAFFISLCFFAVPLGNLSENWSWLRRSTLQAAAIEQVQGNPIWGSGLNTSAALNEQVLSPGEIARFAQPVHNAVLLWLSETGFLGMVLLFLGLKVTQLYRHPALILLLPALLLDHYLLSLQTGLLLLALLPLATVFNQKDTKATVKNVLF